MADNVLINKAATIERCVARAREEYAADPAGFASNFTRLDAAILNILTHHLNDFLEFSRQMLHQGQAMMRRRSAHRHAAPAADTACGGPVQSRVPAHRAQRQTQ